MDKPYKIYVEVDPELVRYYRSLTPEKLNHTRYAPHITVMRKETPYLSDYFWGKYEGKQITFEYSPEVRNDGTYWWLEVYSPELEKLRAELGMPTYSLVTRPPDGRDCYHCTIGNRKNLK